MLARVFAEPAEPEVAAAAVANEDGLGCYVEAFYFLLPEFVVGSVGVGDFGCGGGDVVLE